MTQDRFNNLSFIVVLIYKDTEALQQLSLTDKTVTSPVTGI